MEFPNSARLLVIATKGVNFVLTQTPGVHSFLCLQITKIDIWPQVKWALNLVIAYGHLIFLMGLCGFVWVNILHFITHTKGYQRRKMRE